MEFSGFMPRDNWASTVVFCLVYWHVTSQPLNSHPLFCQWKCLKLYLLFVLLVDYKWAPHQEKYL